MMCVAITFGWYFREMYYCQYLRKHLPCSVETLGTENVFLIENNFKTITILLQQCGQMFVNIICKWYLRIICVKYGSRVSRSIYHTKSKIYISPIRMPYASNTSYCNCMYTYIRCRSKCSLSKNKWMRWSCCRSCHSYYTIQYSHKFGHNMFLSLFEPLHHCYFISSPATTKIINNLLPKTVFFLNSKMIIIVRKQILFINV